MEHVPEDGTLPIFLDLFAALNMIRLALLSPRSDPSFISVVQKKVFYISFHALSMNLWRVDDPELTIAFSLVQVVD